MKIIERLFVPLIAVTSAAGFVVVGCGTTNNNYDTGRGTSDVGQSCTRTFDCKSNLVCLSNICYTGPLVVDASVADGGGDVGAVVVGPRLGSLNESCQTSGDCADGLECISNACSVVSYNLTATGKSCTGECNAAADCCDLPVNFSASLYYYPTAADGGTLPVRTLYGNGIRCQDLLNFVGGDASVCSATSFPIGQEGLATACFDYTTYCNCGPSTWACVNNACAYTGACTISMATTGGCPQTTRTGRALGTTCNMPAGATSGTCQTGCATPADCSDTYPTGNSVHKCSSTDAGPTDCTCYKSSCYFKCTKDIDCASGSTCDTTTSLCKSTGCSTAADCVQSTGKPRAQCVSNKCQIACKNDVECINPPSTVCSAGFCAAPGCASDANCNGGAHLFCVPATTTTYTSAATN